MVDHKSLQALHNGYWPGICFISLIIIIVVVVVALLVVMFLVIIIMVKIIFNMIITIA